MLNTPLPVRVTPVIAEFSVYGELARAQSVDLAEATVAPVSIVQVGVPPTWTENEVAVERVSKVTKLLQS